MLLKLVVSLVVAPIVPTAVIVVSPAAPVVPAPLIVLIRLLFTVETFLVILLVVLVIIGVASLVLLLVVVIRVVLLLRHASLLVVWRLLLGVLGLGHRTAATATFAPLVLALVELLLLVLFSVVILGKIVQLLGR